MMPISKSAPRNPSGVTALFSTGQGVSVGAARAAAGAVHVLGAEAAGLRRGLPLARAVHRLNSDVCCHRHRHRHPLYPYDCHPRPRFVLISCRITTTRIR